MNILIDFTQIPIQKCGVGVYALNLIFKLHEADKENTYYILSQDDDNSLNFIKNGNFKAVKVKSKLFRKFILRLFLEQFYIPYLTLKHKIDRVHSLHYSFPLLLPKGRVVVTVHDMTFFKFPQKHLFIKRYYFKFFIYLASIFADKIITVSESSKRDFLDRFKVKDSRVRVVYHGKSAIFDRVLDKDIERIKNKYKISGEYILFLGTIEPRKNIGNLILAFCELSKDCNDRRLVIAGKNGWNFDSIFRLVEDLPPQIREKIIFTGFIEENEKPFLIAGAKIFVYPSEYEGFGIPVLESLSCGIPTVTSNVSSLPEIAGDAALLVDPLNKGELYINIKRLIEDQELYARLKASSIEQAKKFSWERCARDTIGVYKSTQ